MGFRLRLKGCRTAGNAETKARKTGETPQRITANRRGGGCRIGNTGQTSRDGSPVCGAFNIYVVLEDIF